MSKLPVTENILLVCLNLDLIDNDLRDWNLQRIEVLVRQGEVVAIGMAETREMGSLTTVKVSYKVLSIAMVHIQTSQGF